MFHRLLTFAVLAIFLAAPRLSRGQIPTWYGDYAVAYKAAASDHRLLLLWFCDPEQADANQRIETGVLGQSSIAAAIERRYVAAKLPLDAAFESESGLQRLLDHPSLAEMRGQSGLAVVDLTDPESPHYRLVVSVYPLARGPLSAEKLAVLLELPRGSLTQRTLIFAVRTHPERPASTDGHLSPLLAGEAESHAAHQAAIHLQGHHHWEQRFHSINAQLKGGLLAQEICAESWPGQHLVEAAEECVDSWRQSPGHWDAVSRRHALFGYDMQRGANGVWYATGIFARQN